MDYTRFWRIIWFMFKDLYWCLCHCRYCLNPQDLKSELLLPDQIIIWYVQDASNKHSSCVKNVRPQMFWYPLCLLEQKPLWIATGVFAYLPIADCWRRYCPLCVTFIMHVDVYLLPLHIVLTTTCCFKFLTSCLCKTWVLKHPNIENS